MGVADPEPAARAGNFASYRALLEHDLDGVIVASPTGLHAEHAKAVIEAGRALYLEKPLAHDLAEAEKLAALDHGRCSMAFNYRFHPLHSRAYERWGGRAIEARSVFSIAPRDLSGWRQKRASGGGVLLDLAAHHLDLALRLFGKEPEAVHCSLRSIRYEDDEAELRLDFGEGRRYVGNFSFQGEERDRFEIIGPARFCVDRYAPWRYPVWPPGDWWRFQRERRKAPWREASFEKALRAWVMALRGHRAFPAPLAEGLRVQRVLAQCEK